MAGSGNPRKPPLPPQPLIAAGGKRHRAQEEAAAMANPRMPPRPPQQQQPPSPHVIRRPLQTGDEVEVMIRRKLNGLGDSWFPATVLRKQADDELNYQVVLRGDLQEGPRRTPKTYKVSCDKIRPAADVERFSPGTKLAPRDAVEAFCLGAWSRGEVVRRVDNSDDRYLVMVGSKRRRETTEAEMFELKELRPPSNKANLRKLPSSPPAEVTSDDDDEHSNDPEYSTIEKEKGEPQLLPMVLAQDSEDDPMVASYYSTLSALSKSPASSFLLSGYSAPQDKSMPSMGENPNPVLPNAFLYEYQRGEPNAIEAFMGNNGSSNNVRGELSHGSSRKVVTHLKRLRRKQAGFKKPWNQHDSLDGSVVMDEGLLGLMQSFNSIIESVMMKSSVEDSDASFEERSLTFSIMKANLEYVQSCHHRVTEAKFEYTKHLEENDAVEAQKQEKRNSLSHMHSSVEENDAVMSELHQEVEQHQLKIEQLHLKIEQLRQNGQKIEKDIEHEESELKRLEEVASGIKKACDNDRNMISSILAEVKQKLDNA